MWGTRQTAASEALERALLEEGIPVQLAKNVPKPEGRGEAPSLRFGANTGKEVAHPEGFEPSAAGSEEERTAELTSTGQYRLARFG